jgi:hypothetical protein
MLFFVVLLQVMCVVHSFHRLPTPIISRRQKLVSLAPRNSNDESPQKSQYDIYGPLLKPFAEAVDGTTNGWALEYADLRPFDDKTWLGLLFLATNGAYFWAGIDLYVNSAHPLQSFIIESAGIVSFWYHYGQLKFGPGKDFVRISLVTDYIFAGVAIAITFLEMILFFNDIAASGADFSSLSINFLVYGLVGVACLFGSWIWAFGVPYIILHGLWHILSGLCSAELGSQVHLLHESTKSF